MSTGLPRLGEQIVWLMTNLPGPDGRKYTAASLAEEVTRLGVPTSASHVSQMRQGRRSNPTATLLKAVADAHGVNIAFFLDEAYERGLRDEVEQVQAARESALQRLTEREQDPRRPLQ